MGRQTTWTSNLCYTSAVQRSQPLSRVKVQRRSKKSSVRRMKSKRKLVKAANETVLSFFYYITSRTSIEALMYIGPLIALILSISGHVICVNFVYVNNFCIIKS